MKFFKFIRYIIFSIGYIHLFVMYYFPTEWGKNRNVSMAGRQMKKKHLFAVYYTGFWLLLAFFVKVAYFQ